MSNNDRRAAAQAALKAMALQESASPAQGAARFAALDDSLMRRIDRETTRVISRVHTRPVEQTPSERFGDESQ